MAQFKRIIAVLKKQERHLAAQLASIRTAISSLEFGGGGVPSAAVIETPNAVRARARRRPKMSAAQRKAVSQRMKKYWAERKAGK